MSTRDQSTTDPATTPPASGASACSPMDDIRFAARLTDRLNAEIKRLTMLRDGQVKLRRYESATRLDVEIDAVKDVLNIMGEVRWHMDRENSSGKPRAANNTGDT